MSVDVGSAVGYLDIDISGFLSGLETALSQTESTQNKMEALGNKISGVGKKITTVGSTLTKTITVPLVGVGIAGLKVATDFESGMSQVQAITQATAEQFEDLREEAIELGASTAFSASEVAGAMTEMAKAGWDSQQIIAGMSGVLDAAAASGESLGIVSTIVADAITGFGLTAGDSARVADLLTQAANSGTIGITDLGESFKYIAPVAQSMGFSIEDVTTAISAMSMAGIKGSQAGTSLRTMITNLVKPTDQITTAMEELGIEVVNSDGTMKSLDDIVGILRNSFEGLTEEQKSYYAATLAGKEGMSGLLSLLSLTEEKYEEIASSMDNCRQVAQETASVMQDNLQSKVEQLMGSLESLAIVMADHVIPHIQNFVEWLTGLIEKFTALDPATQQTILTIALIAVAIGPVLTIVGKMVSGFGALASGIGKVSSLFGGFTSAASTAAAPAEAAGAGIGKMAQSALGLLAAGAGILMAAGGLAMLASAAVQLSAAGWPAIAVMVGLTAVMAGLAVGASVIAPALAAGAVGLVAFGAAVALVGVGVLAATGGVTLLATQLPNIATYGSTAAVALIELGIGMISFSSGAVASGASCTVLGAGLVVAGTGAAAAAVGVTALAAGCWLLQAALSATAVSADAIEGSTTSAAKSMEYMVTAVDVVEAGLSALDSAAEVAVTSITNAFSSASTYIKGLSGEAHTWGADIIKGIAAGINANLGTLRGAVDSAANVIRARLHFSVPDEGPLTDYESWMPDFMQGLAKGINDNAYLVGDAADGVAERMKIEPKNAAEGLFGSSSTDGLKEYNITLVNTLGIYKQLLEQMRLCSEYSLSMAPRSNGLLRVNRSTEEPQMRVESVTPENPDSGRKPDVLQVNLQVGEETIETVVVDLLRREVRT